MFRKLFCTLLAVCLIWQMTMAEALPVYENAYLSCICGDAENCTCFARYYENTDDRCTGFLIKTVNVMLIAAGYMEGEASETFGKKTYEALERYQSENGLEVTCVLDDETLTHMFGTETAGTAGTPAYYWVPLHGGEKLHRSSICSGMTAPCIISVSNGNYLIIAGITELCETCFQ